MKKINFKNKKIGIWGMGIVGKSVLNYVQQFTDQIQMMDQSSNASHIAQTQENIANFLEHNDVIIPSPGIMLHDYQHYAHKFIQELDIFAQDNQNYTIAITGTVGKTTITSLIQQCTPNSIAAGNIGYAMLNLLTIPTTPSHSTPIKDPGIYTKNPYKVILELSSYQLHWSNNFAPDLAIWTNFYPNHLDHHKDEAEYFTAKCNLLRYQRSDQIALLPYDLIDKITQCITTQAQIYLFNTNEEINTWILDRCRGRRSDEHSPSGMNNNSSCKTNFEQSFLPSCLYNKPDNALDKTLAQSEITTAAPTDRGSRHKIMHYPIFFIHDNQLLLHQNNQTTIIFDNFNQLPDITFDQNWLIILASLHLQNIELKNLLTQTQTFKPEPHRLEFVKNLNGVAVYNDSKSTVWQATQSAVDRFEHKRIALFLGGISKGTDRSPLIKHLQHKNATVFAFGKEAEMLSTMCQQFQIPHYSASTLQESLKQYKNKEQNFDILLFSPAGASFDLFKNFEDRGKQFKTMIHQLT